jgi:hypothetical protein
VRLAAGVAIAAIGLVLALTVHPAGPGAIDVNVVGWILVAIGATGVALAFVRR